MAVTKSVSPTGCAGETAATLGAGTAKGEEPGKEPVLPDGILLHKERIKVGIADGMPSELLSLPNAMVSFLEA